MTDIQAIFTGITEQLNQAFVDRGWVDFVISRTIPTKDPHWYWRFGRPPFEDETPLYAVIQAAIKNGRLDCNIGTISVCYELADPKFPQNLIQDIIKHLNRVYVVYEQKQNTKRKRVFSFILHPWKNK